MALVSARLVSSNRLKMVTRWARTVFSLMPRRRPRLAQRRPACVALFGTVDLPRQHHPHAGHDIDGAEDAGGRALHEVSTCG